MKKLKLNKTIISTLTREEAKRVMGGNVTIGCPTGSYEGCDPGSTYENCSAACTDVCDTYGCTTITGLPATCNGCQTDFGCPQDTLGSHYTDCGTIC